MPDTALQVYDDDPTVVVEVDGDHSVILEAPATVPGGDVPDASATVKGKLRLAGDLSGSADLPTVPALTTKADVGHTHEYDSLTGVPPIPDYDDTPDLTLYFDNALV